MCSKIQRHGSSRSTAASGSLCRLTWKYELGVVDAGTTCTNDKPSRTCLMPVSTCRKQQHHRSFCQSSHAPALICITRLRSFKWEFNQSPEDFQKSVLPIVFASTMALVTSDVEYPMGVRCSEPCFCLTWRKRLQWICQHKGIEKEKVIEKYLPAKRRLGRGCFNGRFLSLFFYLRELFHFRRCNRT